MSSTFRELRLGYTEDSTAARMLMAPSAHCDGTGLDPLCRLAHGAMVRKWSVMTAPEGCARFTIAKRSPFYD